MSNSLVSVLILTTNDYPGMRIVRVVGPVYGTSVRSRNIIGNFMGGIRAVYQAPSVFHGVSSKWLQTPLFVGVIGYYLQHNPKRSAVSAIVLLPAGLLWPRGPYRICSFRISAFSKAASPFGWQTVIPCVRC